MIDTHWMFYLDPEKLKDKAKWLDPKDGEDRNRVGLLSECAVGKYFEVPVALTLSRRPEVKAGRWIGDIGNDIELVGWKLDIKCQPSAYQPNHKWMWNVPTELAQNPNKECDGYIWTHKTVGNDKKYLLIGWMLRGDFLTQAESHNEGEDKKFENGKYIKDTMDINTEHLRAITELKKMHRDTLELSAKKDTGTSS